MFDSANSSLPFPCTRNKPVAYECEARARARRSSLPLETLLISFIPFSLYLDNYFFKPFEMEDLVPCLCTSFPFLFYFSLEIDRKIIRVATRLQQDTWHRRNFLILEIELFKF